MSFSNHNYAVPGRVGWAVIASSLAFVLLCAPRAALALDTGDIIVATSKGEVHFTINGAERSLRAGSALETPATVRTGRDGAVELRQGATSISVGPDTLLEFPALATAGGPIDRVLQPRGNAFYSIGKRPGRKLRVETPFLVGVVKGTQFNVAAQPNATTISLYEGLLEVRAADDSDVIDLHAGEIARRDRSASDISVLKMDGKVPVVPKAPAGAGGNNATPTSTPAPSPGAPRPQQNVEGDERFAARERDAQPPVESPAARAEVSAPAISNDARVDVVADTPAASVATNTEVVTSAPVESGPGVSVVADTPAASVSTSVDVATSSPVDTSTRVDVVADTPAASVSTSVDVVAETPVASVDTSTAIGNATVDAGASVDLGSTPSVTADANVDLGLDDDVKGNNGNANGIGNGNGYGNGNGNGGGNGLVGSATDTVTTTTDVLDDASNLLDKVTKKPGKK